MEVGDATLANRGGFTHSISASFERPQLDAIYRQVTAPSFRTALSEFSCGEQVPELNWYRYIEPAGEYNERILNVAHQPTFDVVTQRCLMFGLSYLFHVEMFSIDKGEPINYHYRDPLTGKEIPPDKPHLPRKPRCDCSMRDSGKESVTFPDPAPGEPTDKR